MPFVRRAMGRSRLWRGVLAVQRHETARASAVLILSPPFLALLAVSRARARPLRRLDSAFFRAAKPVD